MCRSETEKLMSSISKAHETVVSLSWEQSNLVISLRLFGDLCGNSGIIFKASGQILDEEWCTAGTLHFCVLHTYTSK